MVSSLFFIIFHHGLGILTGRLRGYENDEDLLRLVKKHAKQSF